MIVTKDIEQILILWCRDLIDKESIYTEDDTPYSKVDSERIVIHTKDLTPQTYFSKCFVEVNWCVPDIGDKPDSGRLQQVERRMASHLSTIGEYDGTAYRFAPSSYRTLRGELGYHFVNVRLLFEILNVT